MSQMRTAHARYVEYGDDVRANADWMKVHLLVGVETLVVMAAAFSGSRGENTHDSKFVIRLVEHALKTFSLTHLLGDKAYLSEDILGWLWTKSIKAVIPVKKQWDATTKKAFYVPALQLVEWFDKNQPAFHEIYRLRPKIEAFFSAMKRVTSNFCWSLQ
jgi:Transposase DDE domain